jgi:hypothetical protein
MKQCAAALDGDGRASRRRNASETESIGGVTVVSCDLEFHWRCRSFGDAREPGSAATRFLRQQRAGCSGESGCRDSVKNGDFRSLDGAEDSEGNLVRRDAVRHRAQSAGNGASRQGDFAGQGRIASRTKQDDVEGDKYRRCRECREPDEDFDNAGVAAESSHLYESGICNPVKQKAGREVLRKARDRLWTAVGRKTKRLRGSAHQAVGTESEELRLIRRPPRLFPELRVSFFFSSHWSTELSPLS